MQNGPVFMVSEVNLGELFLIVFFSDRGKSPQRKIFPND